MSVSRTQQEQLLKGINPSRVGKDGKGFAHLEAWDVRAHLIRIFGFAKWSAELIDMQPIFETEGKNEKTGKANWTVAYRATVQLTIHLGDYEDVKYTEAAVGDSTNNPSRADAHDMAIKTAESQAFKRCAINLGDQFGLSLYNNGGTASVVRAVLDSEQERNAAVSEVNATGTQTHNSDEAPKSNGTVEQKIRKVNLVGKPVD